MTLTVMQVLHQGGGAGSVTSTLHLSLGLARAGVRIRFVCPPDSEVEGLARGGGLEVLPLALEAGKRQANAAALSDLLAHHPADLVNSQSSRDREALVRLAIRGRLGVPLVLTRRQVPRTFFLENWLASLAADRVIAVSRAVAGSLRRKGTPAAKLVVIPNGLVTSRVDRRPTAADVEELEKANRVGSEPTNHRHRRPREGPEDGAPRARSSEDARSPGARGVEPDGPLGELAREVQPPHAAVCLPFTSEVRPLYELLEVVLLPSRIEGLSQSLLEAMALGKPVIASAAAGNLDLIRHETDGLLVPPLDPAAWAAAIDRVLGDPALAARLGGAATRTARETFALERTVERTLALYREVVGRPGA